MLIAQNASHHSSLLPRMANRHGLITGATGTGKTVSLQKLAESFSSIGVPVFVSDIKGDLSGVGAASDRNPKLLAHLEKIGVTDFQAQASPVMLWDVFGERGHPVRATISDMGPLLLSRLLDLNDTQSGVLTIVFRIADENGLLLIDLKDLRAMVRHVGENASTFRTEYGNISTASIGAIQRKLLALDDEGGELFFGEPMLNIADLMQTDTDGRGIISILAAEKLYQSPRLYATFLLWLLAELFENLDEVGDADKPRMVFFFDEAHLLFKDAPDALLEKIDQVVRLIRSRGVGIYFVTQNPLDLPDAVLSQLGNRIQHALRAFTPRDQKAVRTAASTLRANPDFDAAEAITELATGEALVSFLDAEGRPEIVQRSWVIAPASRLGPLSDSERRQVLASSLVKGQYENAIDRESAYEILSARAQQATQQQNTATAKKDSALSDLVFGSTGPRGGQRDGLMQTAMKTVTRTISSAIGRQIVRGLLGSILKR